MTTFTTTHHKKKLQKIKVKNTFLYYGTKKKGIKSMQELTISLFLCAKQTAISDLTPN